MKFLNNCNNILLSVIMVIFIVLIFIIVNAAMMLAIIDNGIGFNRLLIMVSKNADVFRLIVVSL